MTVGGSFGLSVPHVSCQFQNQACNCSLLQREVVLGMARDLATRKCQRSDMAGRSCHNSDIAARWFHHTGKSARWFFNFNTAMRTFHHSGRTTCSPVRTELVEV